MSANFPNAPTCTSVKHGDSVFHPEGVVPYNQPEEAIIFDSVQTFKTIDEMFEGIDYYKIFREDIWKNINKYNINNLEELTSYSKKMYEYNKSVGNEYYQDYNSAGILCILEEIKPEDKMAECKEIIEGNYNYTSPKVTRILKSELTNEQIEEIMDSFENYENKIKQSDYYGFKNSIKSIWKDPSTNEDVIQYEQKMKNMGIDVSFSDNIELAEIVTEAFEDLQNKGYNLPAKIIIGDSQNYDVSGLDFTYSTKGLIFLDEDTLDLNSYIGYQDIRYTEDQLMALLKETLKKTVYHEAGHFINHNNPNNSEAQKVWKMAAEKYHKIEKEVSKYAATDKDEFIAEVFAGVMTGKKYDDEIMNLYYSLGGILY